MKKILTGVWIVVFMAVSLQGNAQSTIFKPFKVDVGIVAAVSTDDEAGSGGGFYIEPKYNVNDRINVGLRLESAFLGSGSIRVGGTSVDIESASVAPILLTGDYYFHTERVRPYVGLGMGMYRRQERSISTDIGSVALGLESQTNFGVAPRVGLNAGHFKLAVIYNFTGNHIADYLGINVGMEIGGGYQ